MTGGAAGTQTLSTGTPPATTALAEAPLVKTPLVEPANELTREELLRYSRHLTLPQIGAVGQRRLKNARVLVIGAGGLGSPVLLYLAAAGVGRIGVVDDDVVDTSNLQRQVIHGVDDLGRAKVESAADAVARINPLVTVLTHHTRISAENAVDLVSGYDLVIDGADNFATRYIVSDACTLTATPCVWGSILRFQGRVSVFWNNPGHTGISYRDLHPDAPAPGEVPSCSAAGVLGALPGAIGALMVTEAVKLITGHGEPLYGRLLLHDSLTMAFRELAIHPDPDAPPVTEASLTTPATPLDPANSVHTGHSEDVGGGAGGNGGRGSPHGGTVASHCTVRPAELQARLDAGAVLIDIREEWERELISIPGAVALPLAELEAHGADALPGAAQGKDVIFHCKSGHRSAKALGIVAPYFARREETASHLCGGILSWISEVHPEVNGY